jgi:hypothetical protein
MKKLVIAFALISVVCTAIFSCNNGPYDAHPDADLGSALNPLSPDSGGTSVYLGSMEATINDKKLLFAPAFYFTDSVGIVRMIARVKNDSIFHRTLRISFATMPTKKTYEVHADTIDPQVSLVMLDTSRVDLAGRKIYKTYKANTNDGVGYSVVHIAGDEGGNLRGHYFGKLHRTLPEKQYGDTLNISFSPFYFKKVPFPVPGEYIEYLMN